MSRKDGPAAFGVDHEDAVLVGRLLRQRRLSRDLTSEAVALTLRVAERHVLAVEEGRFADLPPQPYARGLLNSYATLLGFEPEELLRACGSARSGEVQGIFRYPLRDRFIWREWAAPFAFAAVVAAIVSARAVLTPAPIDLENPAPVVIPRLVRNIEALAEVPSPVGPQEEKPVAVPGVRVTLLCEGTTWAEAASDGGPPQRYDLGPGQRLAITAREKLSLSLGDAGVLRLRVNGRELGFIGNKGEEKIGLSFRASPGSTAAGPAVFAGD